jgi:hypothetical protein
VTGLHLAEGAGISGGKPMYGTKLWATKAGAWAKPIAGVRAFGCLGCGRIVQYTEDVEHLRRYTEEHPDHLIW